MTDTNTKAPIISQCFILRDKNGNVKFGDCTKEAYQNINPIFLDHLTDEDKEYIKTKAEE